MISGVGGLIEASGVGESDGDSAGVGDVEGVGLATGVGEGLTSGEFVACWFVWVQLANSNINPATTNAGTPPLFTLLLSTLCAANCIADRTNPTRLPKKVSGRPPGQGRRTRSRNSARVRASLRNVPSMHDVIS
jgi:hypothetical protein